MYTSSKIDTNRRKQLLGIDIIMSIVGIATILAVQNVIEAVSRAAATKPWGVRDLPPISQEDTVTKLNLV